MFKNYRNHAVVQIALVIVLIAGIFNIQPAKAEAVDFGWAQGGGAPILIMEPRLPWMPAEMHISQDL